MSRCPDASRRVQPIRRLSVQSGGSLTPDDWTDGVGRLIAPEQVQP
jgi:hypothetical protein